MEQDDDVRRRTIAKAESPLFGDVLLESQPGFRKSRGAATVTSFVLLTTIFTTMALVPLFFPEALPKQQLLTTLIAPPAPPPPPPPAPAAAPQVVKAITHSELLTNSRLQAPSAIPQKIALLKEDAHPESAVTGVVGGVPGGIPGGELGGVIGGIISSVPAAATIPKLARAPNKPVLVSSGICEGLLIFHPSPDYPKLARAAHVQGQVLLRAVISKDGRIVNLQTLNGHPLLVTPAIKAVQQWRYRPYLLNGEPVEVETEITVNFMLSAQG
jgi:periplasmic protein TonB